MKKVKIEIEVEVDDEINWIAKEKDGRVFGYEFKPEIYLGQWSMTGATKFLFKVKPNTNWKNSLTKVKL